MMLGQNSCSKRFLTFSLYFVTDLFDETNSLLTWQVDCCVRRRCGEKDRLVDFGSLFDFVHDRSFRSIQCQFLSFIASRWKYKSLLLRQLIFIFLSWSVIFLARSVKLHYLLHPKIAGYGLALSIFFLVLVRIGIFGVTVNGAQRWISLFGIQFQPSELANLFWFLFKLVFVTEIVAQKI